MNQLTEKKGEAREASPVRLEGILEITDILGEDELNSSEDARRNCCCMYKD